MNKCRGFAVSLLVLFIFNCFCGLTSYAATEEHVERIFNKIAAEEGFLTSIYEAGTHFTDRGVTNEYIDLQIKNIIANTINTAVRLKRTDKLTEGNFTETMKEATKNIYASLNSIILAVFLEAFPSGMFADIMANRMPEALAPLFNNVMEVARELLFVENIADTPDYRFLDLEGHIWAKEAILSLTYAGVIDGMDEFNFVPSDRITREQFVKLMAVICGLDIENTEAMTSEFDDVPKDSWFYPYVTAMADFGYVKGVDYYWFGTGQLIKRQDIAVLIYRIGTESGKLSINSETHAFVDSDMVSDYAADAVNLLYSHKIITGTPENYFHPNESATRAEAAQMLYKFYKIYMGS